ncbi:baseplate assembly protein [Dethiosulfatarculus sandiegensis]|uniref:Baseplate J protein n=1 Tax=Dethiosulfatarculus sandiegensis TaxID=1429043 RepID=A0A0D2GJQ5_9BACT|nr:baseplate J/gp47 family protein [Dethiosulfatarculus sandiegensis]KIX14987.1 baseplate J protein [Dethiosulfatarculus sandiegensis]
MNLNSLPEIAFCETDAAKVEAAVIADYERITGKALYPGAPERLFCEAVAYVIALQRFQIDYAGKMNLVTYADSGYLDHLGALLNTTRLGESPASTTLRYSLASPLNWDVVIYQGSRVTADGSLYFATDQEAVIPAGQNSVEVVATCQALGTVGNGFQPGQLNQMVDRPTYVATVVNTAISLGGVDSESDARFRGRVQLAPERLSCAGPKDAYRYHAMSVSQAISDVAVWSPAPGKISVSPLLAGGEMPTPEIIAAVAAQMGDKKVRPLTDLVTVHYPDAVPYSINGKYWVLTSYANQAAAIERRVIAEVDNYIAWQKAKLGRSIRPSELIAQIQSIDGIQRVEVATPEFQSLEPWQVAQAESASIIYGGLTNE